MQKHFQNFEKLNVYLRKIENVQIFFKGVRAQINAKFLGKHCAIYFCLLRAF